MRPGRPGDEAWLEHLLRSDAARQRHIADDGFADRVLRHLPLPVRVAPRWLVPGAAALGSAIAVGLTPAGAYLASSLVGLLDPRHFSLAHLAVLVPIAVFYGCSFAALHER